MISLAKTENSGEKHYRQEKTFGKKILAKNCIIRKS
jgi:hypothetical protein